jgi:hypothetical protein
MHKPWVRKFEGLSIRAVMKPNSSAKEWSPERMKKFTEWLTPKGRELIIKLYREHGRALGPDEHAKAVWEIPKHMEELSQYASAAKMRAQLKAERARKPKR